MEIKGYKLFLEGLALTDKDIPNVERNSELSENEFLDILNKNCKNFSFSNTLLWRSKYQKHELSLFKPAPRNASPLAFKDFFNDIEHNLDEYPVVRKNSLIGGTDKDICKQLVGEDMYLVIPFDDSKIVFTTTMDLWALSDDRRGGSERKNLIKGKPISKDNFTMINYTKNFKYLDKGEMNKGCEFFLSSPCLLVRESKLQWLRTKMA